MGAEFIRANKDVAWEESNRGKPCHEIWADQKRMPPCTWTIGAFSATETPVRHVHPFIGNAQSRIEEFPAYSVGTWSYDQMYNKHTRKLEDFEEREENIESFFESFEPGRSLVFLYLNFDNPLNPENKKYVLVGISRLIKLGPYLKFDGLKEWQVEKYGDRIWSRHVVHGYPSQGVRIPYQEYLRLGKPIEPILIEVEGEIDRRFKYVARQLSDDDACELIERMIKAIRQVDTDGYVSGKWKHDLEWLDKVLGETWNNRGPYPGLGSVLGAVGVRNGNAIARRLSKEQPGVDLRQYAFDCLEGRTPVDWSARAQRYWGQYKDTVKGRLLHLLACFDLSKDQIENIISEKREDFGIRSGLSDILEDPYVLCEEYQGEDEDDAIGFYRIDNGIFPEKIGQPAVEMDLDDPRRIRALMIERMRMEEKTGNCFLDLPEVIEHVENKRLGWRSCRTSEERIRADQEFYEKPHKLALKTPAEHTFVYLQDVISDEELVKNRIETLLKKEYEASGEDWKIHLALPHPNIPEDIYQRVLSDQSDAVERSYTQRLSVITGAAGTGKTTVIKALIRGIKEQKPGATFLLLTPTGKARERLHQATEMPAKTIHRALMENKWLSSGTYRLVEGTRIQVRNLIVDEASMVDLRLFAHLFRAIDWNHVERLVLVGDPNQLPPIGLGRPFFDIVSFLVSSEHKPCVSSLVVNCRQMVEQSTVLKLANLYTDNPAEDFEELLNKIEKGTHFKDLDVVYWKDERDLQSKLQAQLEQIIQDEGIKTSDKMSGLSQLLDVRMGRDSSPKSDRYGVEYFQMLSPYRGEYYGTGAINFWMQQEYRGKMLASIGSLEGLTAGDKIIQVVNTVARQKGTEHELFNGQLGYVKFVKKERPRSSLIIFEENERDQEVWFQSGVIERNVELGYCISVHKAQGSEFDVVFLVLPQEKLGLLSRELLYTGLTRSKRRLILFLQGSIAPLLHGMSLANSAILLRNTSLFKLRFTSEKYRANDLIHRTDRADKAEYVRSKSEVIVANELLRHRVSYEYEDKLYSVDGSEWKLPDFTIQYEGDTWYWEHLGRLRDPEYLEQWERKKKWYEKNGYFEKLIVSDELSGFDSTKIVKLIKTKFGIGS